MGGDKSNTYLNSRYLYTKEYTGFAVEYNLFIFTVLYFHVRNASAKMMLVNAYDRNMNSIFIFSALNWAYPRTLLHTQLILNILPIHSVTQNRMGYLFSQNSSSYHLSVATLAYRMEYKISILISVKLPCNNAFLLKVPYK